nr:MAG TPA: N-deoxyribosyltransferase [Caudoviricetes sp.]
MKTVYLAGKITGDPNYREKFKIATEWLEAQGYIVLSPTLLPSVGFEYEAYMRMTLAMLKECDQVYFLSDWEESNGAKQEMDYVLKNNIPYFFLCG